MKTKLARTKAVPRTGPRHQAGIVLPLIAICLLAMMAVAGLALDGSHTLTNVTRLQNTADSAALAAAKIFDETAGNTDDATAAAHAIFGLNTDGSGNHELDSAYDGGEVMVTVQYSATVAPFNPGSGPGPFVRVRAQNFIVPTTLSKLLGRDEIITASSAVAGPVPVGSGEGSEICGLAPMLVCPLDPTDTVDFGFTNGLLQALKPEPGNHGDVGPGNFKMLSLGCPGGNCLRDNLAGGFETCIGEGDTVDTEPGYSHGPTRDGLNTRFNVYHGGMQRDEYPPDLLVTETNPTLSNCVDQGTGETYVIEEPSPGGGGNFNPGDPCPASYTRFEFGSEISYNYDRYRAETDPDSGVPHVSDGVEGRRLMVFPVTDCSGDDTGRSALDVLGYVCLFLLQKVGQGAQDQGIYGEFVNEGCEVDGSGGSTPGGGPGNTQYKIVLYKDSDSSNS